MTIQPFEDRQKQLIEEWERNAKSAETEDEVGRALLDLFIERERIRRGVETPSPAQILVDCETLEQLKNARSLGPEFSFAEAAFRRLVDDPASAIKYIEQSKANFSQAQSRAARKARPNRHDNLTKLINSIVAKTPNISAKEVGRKLEANEDVQFNASLREFVHDDDRSSLNEKNLASRVSDAKKRVSG